MAVILNASTTTGFVQTADTSGEIVLQNNGTTRLTVNASGVTIPTLTATTVTGTITQGTAVASTSGTSIDFTGIPSWTKRIVVMFNAVSTNTTNWIPLVQLGDSGGIENTGYTSTFGTPNLGVSSTAGFNASVNANSASAQSGQMTIYLLTGNTWVFSSVAYSPDYGNGVGSGAKTLSDTLDRIRFTTVAGTHVFDAGTINLQYEG